MGLGLGGQQQKGLHLPAHPLILVIDDLFPDAHGKARDVNRDQAAIFDVLAHGEFRQKGNALVVEQQADDKFRVADFQKRISSSRDARCCSSRRR